MNCKGPVASLYHGIYRERLTKTMKGNYLVGELVSGRDSKRVTPEKKPET
jgi:hypothetical protein